MTERRIVIAIAIRIATVSVRPDGLAIIRQSVAVASIDQVIIIII